MTLVQFSDLHIGATTGGDPPTDLRAALDAVTALVAASGDEVDALLVTGDLVNDGTAVQYEEVQALLGTIDVPVHVLPGNHDDRSGLRAAFPLDGGGEADAPYRYAARVGGLRLIACDTLVPGQDGGAFGAEQVDWLAACLAEDTTTPTLVAMHHPPFHVGMPPLDAIGLPAEDRAALGALLARHPQVHRVACGHVHLVAAGTIGGVPALTAPSVWTVQFALDLGSPDVRVIDGTPGMVVHTLVDGALVSHVRHVAA